MGSLWQSKMYLQNAAILLVRQYFNRRDLDLSKGVMWVSVDQRASRLRSTKLEHNPIVQDSNPGRWWVVRHWPSGRISFRPPKWKLVTLQPFNLQRSTVPLWKDLNLFKNISSTQRTNRIIKMSFTVSKWPHLHRAPYSFSETVWSFKKSISKYVNFLIWHAQNFFSGKEASLIIRAICDVINFHE